MQTLDEQLGPILASKPEALGNRFPVLNELRRRTPVYEYHGTYLLTRYADVKNAMAINDLKLRRSQVGTAVSREALSKQAPEDQEAWQKFWKSWGSTVVNMEGLEHERLRRIAHRGFTPARVAALGPTIRQFADEVLDDFSTREGPVDIMSTARSSRFA
jgi:hypothetical protein